jgi:short-subunit dehydrogenase
VRHHRGNNGIGLETAKGLARMGARIVMVCRDKERGEASQKDVQKVADAPVELLIADL